MQRAVSAFALLLVSGCGHQTGGSSTPAQDPVEVRLFALSDFHGWLSPRTTRSSERFYGGIAHIAASIEHQGGGAQARILVDNGDMWTGPTESTFLRGAPVVEAYNLLGFSAANVANHEFDFGRSVLEVRAQEARFPFLGANIVERATGSPPGFVKPWVIEERLGVSVGILGLSFIKTAETTLATHVADLEFLPYAETLRREVPKLRKAGASVVAVLLHDTSQVGRELVEEVGGELGLDLVVVGQDHRKSVARVDGIPVVNPGPFGASYAKLTVRVDRATGSVISVTPEIVDVGGLVSAPPYPPRAELTALVQRAKSRTRELADQNLGALARPLPVGQFEASPLGQFVVDSWLNVLDETVDFALLNHGALRQPLPAGAVSLAALIGAMPFENNIYIVELTGLQIASQLEIDHPVVSGFTWTFIERDGKRTVRRILDLSGASVRPNQRYRVAILDFMYLGGDGFQFAAIDPDPVDTGLSWRDPVVRALRAAEASRRPIEPRTQPRASHERPAKGQTFR